MGKNFLTSLLAGPVARGSILSMAVSLFSIALVTLQAILTARILGPEGYGTVAYVMSLAAIFSMVALLGTHQLAVREVARLQSAGESAKLLGFVASIRRIVLILVGLGAAGWIAGMLYLAKPVFPMLFVALIFPALALTGQTQSILRGFGDVALSQLPLMIIRPILTVAVLAVALVSSIDLTPVAYLTTILAATSLACFIAWRAARPRLEGMTGESPESFGNLLRSAAPFFVISVVTLVQAEINTLMLAWWSGPAETGLFQPIARVAPVLMLGMQAVGVRYGPRVAEFWNAREIDRLRQVTQKVTLTTTGFTVLAAIALIILGEWILGLFGAAFAAKSAALYWVAAAQVFNAGCGPVGLLLTMTDKAGAAVWPHLAGLLVNLGLGVLLIPNQGAMGAATAMAGGIAVWNLASLIVVRRRMGFDPSLIGALRRAA